VVILAVDEIVRFNLFEVYKAFYDRPVVRELIEKDQCFAYLVDVEKNNYFYVLDFTKKNVPDKESFHKHALDSFHTANNNLLFLSYGGHC
jgi:hypothetical protein